MIRWNVILTKTLFKTIRPKDHKENFRNNTKCRLINSSKSDISLISKKYLGKIISEVKEKTGANQWWNSFTVINWFINLGNKNKLKFIKFNTAEFYPSISEELLDKAVKTINYICDNVITAIKLARKSLLFNEEPFLGWKRWKNILSDNGELWWSRDLWTSWTFR